MKTIKSFVFTVIAFFVVGMMFVYSGTYPIGADVPHNKFTVWILETLREKSINAAAMQIEVPSLEGPELLLAGGADYNDMCAVCHLKPGKSQSDMSLGLYPVPMNLSLGEEVSGDVDQISRRHFWIIKHGIKASGMPAWGPTHDDQRIWAMVAFLKKLPTLTPDQYQIITARDEADATSHH